tara:strand:+ start:158 stop:343 length:186 start_codon:yes stop_codon:yes gene_type:complete
MGDQNTWYAAERRLFENRPTDELVETREIMKNGFMYHRRQIRLQAIDDILAERAEKKSQSL